MKRRTANSLWTLLLLALATTLPVAHASARDESTQLTFNQPIQIPGQTLPAGTYSFKLINTNSGRDIVQIASADSSQVYATLVTRVCERPEVTDQTEVKLAKRESDLAVVLTQWYYPVLLEGHEFVYPSQLEREPGPEQVVMATEVGPDQGEIVVSSGQ